MKLEEVSQFYDQKASEKYDRRVENIFRKFLNIEKYRIQAINNLGDISGKHVLDIGCGTGLNLQHLVQAVGKSGRITCIDYSQAMLQQARQKISENNWSNVELVFDDVVHLDKIDTQVDAVVSTYCLGLLYDTPEAIRTILNKLKTGGSVSILDFSGTKARYSFLSLLYPIYSRLFVFWGFDTPEDMKDSVIRRKWKEGREILQLALEDYVESSFLELGLSIHGKKR